MPLDKLRVPTHSDSWKSAGSWTGGRLLAGAAAKGTWELLLPHTADCSALSPSALALPVVLHLSCPKGSCSLVLQQELLHPPGIPTCCLLPLGGAAPSRMLASAQQHANSIGKYLTGTKLYTSVISRCVTWDPRRCSSSEQQRTCSSLQACTEKAFSKLSCLPLASSA